MSLQCVIVRSRYRYCHRKRKNPFHGITKPQSTRRQLPINVLLRHNITTLLGRESNINPSTHAAKHVHESNRSYLIHVALLAHHVRNFVRKSYQIWLTPDKHVIAYVALTEQYMSCIYMYMQIRYIIPGMSISHPRQTCYVDELGNVTHTRQTCIIAHVALSYFD